MLDKAAIDALGADLRALADSPGTANHEFAPWLNAAANALTDLSEAVERLAEPSDGVLNAALTAYFPLPKSLEIHAKEFAENERRDMRNAIIAAVRAALQGNQQEGERNA